MTKSFESTDWRPVTTETVQIIQVAEHHGFAVTKDNEKCYIPNSVVSRVELTPGDIVKATLIENLKEDSNVKWMVTCIHRNAKKLLPEPLTPVGPEAASIDVEDAPKRAVEIVMGSRRYWRTNEVVERVLGLDFGSGTAEQNAARNAVGRALQQAHEDGDIVCAHVCLDGEPRRRASFKLWAASTDAF